MVFWCCLGRRLRPNLGRRLRAFAPIPYTPTYSEGVRSLAEAGAETLPMAGDSGHSRGGDSGPCLLTGFLSLTLRGFGACPEQLRRLRPRPETPAPTRAETPVSAPLLFQINLQRGCPEQGRSRGGVSAPGRRLRPPIAGDSGFSGSIG